MALILRNGLQNLTFENIIKLYRNIYTEIGGSRFFQNFGTNLQHYTRRSEDGAVYSSDTLIRNFNIHTAIPKNHDISQHNNRVNKQEHDGKLAVEKEIRKIVSTPEILISNIFGPPVQLQFRQGLGINKEHHDIVGTVYHLVIYMQFNKIHKVFNE